MAAIEDVFKQWRRLSPFMPSISDIAGLLAAWHRDEAARIEDEQRAEEKRIEAERLAAGEPQFGLGDVAEKFKKIIESKSMPDLSPERKKELAKQVEDLSKGKRTVA